MAQLYHSLSTKPQYWDRQTHDSPEQWFTALASSDTLYIGNLSFYVTEDQIYELFSSCGTITRIVLGLNSKKRVPCGFCFIQFATHTDAANARLVLNGVVLDGRVIRCDWDTGKDILKTRKFGRGLHGGQFRDDREFS